MNLFEYQDYRAYLKDFYDSQKRENPTFSYRAFAYRAKLGSPNYLKLVIEGSRRITDKNLSNFVRGLRLAGQEADYFRNLVLLEAAGDEDARRAYGRELERLRTLAKNREAELLEDQKEVLRQWYHPVISQMALLKDFRDDPKWVAGRLKGLVTEAQASDSLALLKRLGLLVQTDGNWTLCEPIMTTSDDVVAPLVRELHRQFFELALRSVTADKMDEREISGLTIAVSKDRLQEIKSAIKGFRVSLNKTFSSTEDNDDVYHLAVAFFPLTKKGSVG